MTQLTPSPEGSTTMFRSPMTRVALLAFTILALSASTAQARPTGAVYIQQSSYPGSGYHTFYRPIPASGPAVVVTPTVGPVQQPAAESSAGFNWTAAMVAVGLAGVVLLLAAIPARRIRVRRVAQL